MKKHFITLIAIAMVAVSSTSFATAKIDPALITFARGESANRVTRVVAIMKAPENFQRYQSERYDHEAVVHFLLARAKASYAPINDFLIKSGELQKNIALHKFHYINNSFSADVTAEGLKIISEIPQITKIYANHEVTFDRPLRVQPGIQSRAEAATIPYDFVDMGLDKLIKERPEITGKGVIIGSVDTGADGTHPALRGKILAFFNGKTHKLSEPVDFDQHGTHTAGTMVGGDRSSLLIGMAPEAKLIVAGALTDYDTMLEGMRFMLDPDGNPQTKDMPRVINNSWNCDGAPDVELFYNAISAWEAAGIMPVFSAGNAGPGPGTITKPHEYPGTFAVGATGLDGKITRFSSRGPGNYKGQATQKPEATAPGAEINSSIPGGGYAKFDGTSMATPHVTGLAALILQVNPALTPAQIREILLRTAQPMTEGGSLDQEAPLGSWDKAYGFGKINAYKAVLAAAAVKRMQLSEGFGSLNMMNAMVSPQAADMKAFLSQDERTVASALNNIYPAAFEGRTWVSAQEVW